MPRPVEDYFKDYRDLLHGEVKVLEIGFDMLEIWCIWGLLWNEIYEYRFQLTKQTLFLVQFDRKLQLIYANMFSQGLSW